MSLATVLSIVAILIALGALIVSGLNHRHTVERDKRREQRTIKVTCRYAILSQPISVYDARLGNEPAKYHALEVRAVNNGHRPVELRGVHFETATGNVIWADMIQGMSDALPKRIDDGESVNLFFDYDKLEAETAKRGHRLARALVSDADSKTYAGPYPEPEG